MKKLFIFDLDNTLTESRTLIDPEMAGLFCRLLEKSKVAVISGASFAQFEKQLLSGLSCKERFGELFIIPTNGAELWECPRGTWQRLYSHPMSAGLGKKVSATIAALAKIPSDKVSQYIDDLGTQVTYSALGIDASIEEKKKYDPDEKKRRDFVRKIAAQFPELSFEIAGRTSINAIMKGVDKSFGIKQLLVRLEMNASDALFVGDALYEGGNDEAGKAAGEEVLATAGPEETKKIIADFLKQYEK